MNTKILYILLLIFLGIASTQPSWSQVIKNETIIEIDSKGRKRTERTLLIQVNSKSENWLSHVEIRHNPKQEFTFNYAKILDNNGNSQHKLKKKDISTRNDLSHSAFYQDDLITEFELYWNKFPYLIEYSYTIQEDEFLFVAWWSPAEFSNVSTLEGSLKITVPTNYEININASDGMKHLVSKLEDKQTFTWRSSYIRKSASEIYSPQIIEQIPKVKVVPLQFTYEITGNADSWSSLGLWLDQLNNGTDELTLNEQRIVQELVGGIEEKVEIVKTIYHYLQDNTRYVNVAIDVGGLKSYPASYVCWNKYGDCKALTTYMKSMLKSVGIESVYSVINAGIQEAPIEVNFPSLQFNHVILAVPLKNDTIWLENTSNAAPFNYLGTFTQNRHALAVTGFQSKLISTPTLNISDVLVERNYAYTLTGQDIFQINTSVTLRGKSFEDFRYYLANGEEKYQNNEVVKYINIDGYNSISWENRDFNRDNTFVELVCRGESGKVLRRVGDWQVINPLNISVPDFEKPEERNLAVRISYPINMADTSVFDLNDLKEKEVQLPEEMDIESPFGNYKTSYLLEDNKVTVYEKFTLLATQIELQQYNEFYSFLETINSYKKKSIILIK